jgi:hypothetical protein
MQLIFSVEAIRDFCRVIGSSIKGYFGSSSFFVELFVLILVILRLKYSELTTDVTPDITITL